MKKSFLNSKKIKTIHPFFTTTTNNNLHKIEWNQIYDQSLIIGKYRTEEITKVEGVLGMDLDGTLIKTKGKHLYSKDEYDWEFLIRDMKKVLNDKLQGRTLVIFTNQNGLDPDKMSKNDKQKNIFKKKMQLVTTQLDIPLLIFATTKKDRFRKPCIGMWQQLKLMFEDKLDDKNSIYVGDAAGREQIGKLALRKDHSDTDRKFAMNLNLPFFTPEEFFLDEKEAKFALTGFNPNKYIEELDIEKNTIKFEKLYDFEVVLLMGFPASGKSHFYEKLAKPLGYERINRDTLITLEKCISTMDKYLKNKTSVVIDNTNVDALSRQPYIKKAIEHSAKIRIIIFNASYELSYHNNLFRAYYPLPNLDAKNKREAIPKFVFDGFQRKWKEPVVDDTISDIQYISFIPQFLDKDNNLEDHVVEHYKKYWTKMLF